GRGVERPRPAHPAGQTQRLAARIELDSPLDRRRRGLLRRRQTRPLPAERRSPLGHACALQRRRLLPTLATAPPQAPWPTPHLWPQKPPPGLVSLPQALPQGPQSGLWGSRHHPPLLLPGLVVAALGPAGPLRLGEPPNPRQRDPPVHRFDLGPTGDYSPLRLAVQNRSQLQTSHSHRWRLCVSLLDARHDSHPPRQRQTVCATQVGDLPRPHPPQARRLRAAYPVGSDCPGIAPIPGAQLPVRHLVQFPLLYPHRLLEKTPFGMGRLPRAPSHLATISPRFIPKRNPQEIPGLQNQPQTLRLFRYLSTGESGMNLPLSSWMIVMLNKAKTVMRRVWSRWTARASKPTAESDGSLTKVPGHENQARRSRYRLGHRSGRLSEIPWQIVPNNSVNLTL